MKKKTIGIILLVLFGLAILGSIVNGTFANLGNKNIGFYIGFFGGLGALLIFGIRNLISKEMPTPLCSCPKEAHTVIFKMITDEGQSHNFTYSEHTRYSPNRSSTCGYGSDNWMYLCKENEKHYLLTFTCNASFGTGWMCTELTEGDYENLLGADVKFWGDTAYSKERTKTYAIHLTDVDSVRHLLPTSSRCCDKLSDEMFLR